MLPRSRMRKRSESMRHPKTMARFLACAGRWCWVNVRLRAELTAPGGPCGGGDREDLAPMAARDQPGECGEPDPVGRLVADPGDLTAQHCGAGRGSARRGG